MRLFEDTILLTNILKLSTCRFYHPHNGGSKFSDGSVKRDWLTWDLLWKIRKERPVNFLGQGQKTKSRSTEKAVVQNSIDRKIKDQN